MMEDINLKKGKQKTLGTFDGHEESLPDLSGNYISKISDGNNNLEHHSLESYISNRPLLGLLQQCTLSQDFRNSHPLSCPVGTNENQCPITPGFHQFDKSIENLHFGTAEMLNCMALEREDADSDDLILEDILSDTSFSELEIEDSYWKELVREFESVKDGYRNDGLNSSSVEKDFAFNCDSTSNQFQQHTDSKHRHNVNMDNNFADPYLLVTAEPSFTPTSQDPRPRLSKADEDLLEFFSKSPVSHTECRDSAHSSSYSDVFVSDVAVRPDTSRPLGTHLKRRRPSDYSGCENREDDLLMVYGLDDSSQRSHLRRKFSLCHASEPTQYHHSESQAVASLNFDSTKTGNNNTQAITAFNVDSDEFPCALSVRNDIVSATGSKGTAHVEQDGCDSFRLASVLPQLPFSLPSVPAEYQLVITHQSVPTSNSTVEQQLTQIIMSKQSCLATDRQQKSVSKLYQSLPPSAHDVTCSTLYKNYRNAGIISPTNSGSDFSMEMSSPTVSAFLFENLTKSTADAFDEMRCQSTGTDCAGYPFPYSSSLCEPKLEHKLAEVLDMSWPNRPAPNDIIYEKHNCGYSGTLLSSSPVCTGLCETSCTTGSIIKPPQKVQSCPVSPEIHFLSKLQLTTERAEKCSWTVPTDGTRNVFASAAEQTSTVRSLMPVRLPHAFRGAPTVHSRSELAYLVDGVFPPNAAIVSKQQIPPINTRSSSLACTDTISLTSEILPISSPDWSANPVAVASPASNCKSLFSSFQTSAASLNSTGRNLPKVNVVRACSADAAVSESDGESISYGCPEKSCSLHGFHISCANLLSPGCSYAQFSGANLCQSQHKATVFDCKSSGLAQVQEQSVLLCASEVIESAEDNSWNDSDCEVHSDRSCDPTVTVPSSPDILQTVSQCNSKDCGRTCQSDNKASNCSHYSDIAFHDSGTRVKSEVQNSPQNRTSQPEPPSNIDSQTTCLHLFLDAPMSARPSESQVDDNNRITYLNKGQYYRLTMGCLSVDQFSTRATAFKIIMVCIHRNHERPFKHALVVKVLTRRSDSSDDQLGSWRTWRDRQQSYKQRILDVDFKDSYGVHLDSMEELAYNATSFRWNVVDQPVRVNISVNCLSTDFTNRKGVKGKPLLIQVDTYEYDQPSLPIHRAYCKIKVFCEKGAERKVRDEERKKESNKMTIKTDDNDVNCEKADESKVTSSVSNFVPIQDLNRIPVFFRPDDSLGLKQITKGKSYLPTSKCITSSTDRFEKRAHSQEENIGIKKKLYPDEVITSRECQKVLLYVRRCHDEAFTALMLQTPTVPALIDALQEQCNIEMQEIRTVYKKSKKGILVKLDDKTLRLYSNESTFIIDVESVTSSAQEETALYDVILTEIDVDMY